MKTHILKGSKQEIVEELARIKGEVREAIVFVEDPALPEAGQPAALDVFAEMYPFMVDVQVMDDSREAIYSRMEGE